MEKPKFMISIVTDTTEIEDWLQQNGFELMSSGMGSFEYMTDKEVDEDALIQRLASMIISVRDLRE